MDAFRESTQSLRRELDISNPIITGYFDVHVRRVIPVLAAVLNNEFDAVIWKKVYDLLTESTPTTVVKLSTPPSSRASRTASFQQTPWTFNTASFADTSDLSRNVDPILN